MTEPMGGLDPVHPVILSNFPLRRSASLACFALLLAVSRAPSQPSFFEPKEGYYGARGAAVKASWAVDRDTVPADGSLVATLTVRGVSNPREVKRPELAKLPAFRTKFQIDDVPGPPPAADAKEVSFAYRLRPRGRDVTRVPSLDFFYLNTSVKAGNPFQNARAVGRDLTVTAAAPKPKPPAAPVPGPDRLFAVETGPAVLAGPPFTPGPAAWASLAAAAVLVPLGWYAAWRVVYPDAAALARRRRSRAARRALAAIRAANRSADPAGECAAAVLAYLRERYPLPPGADTPPEAAAALAVAGLSAGLVEDVTAFLRGCDAARFAAGDTAVSPAAAVALVGTLETAR